MRLNSKISVILLSYKLLQNFNQKVFKYRSHKKKHQKEDAKEQNEENGENKDEDEEEFDNQDEMMESKIKSEPESISGSEEDDTDKSVHSRKTLDVKIKKVKLSFFKK